MNTVEIEFPDYLSAFKTFYVKSIDILLINTNYTKNDNVVKLSSNIYKGVVENGSIHKK